MKSTALTQKHVLLGAKMVPYAGFNMPISYTGIKDEHNCVRNRVGVFDVSHMGQFVFKGESSLDLIQRITTNDASTLEVGQAQYTCFPNKTGGIVDDLLVYRLQENNYMLVVNAANIEKDWNWIKAHNTDAVELVNISNKTGVLAVQGPKATETLQGLTEYDLSTIPYYHFTKTTFAGVENVLISNTGYTGSGGFELYFRNEQADVIWDAIFKAGEPYGIQPCGLGARDTLRLEMGYCLYGNELNEQTSPIEAGLGWITKFNKSVPFNSEEIFAQQKVEGISKKLIGLVVKDRGIARKGYEILNEEGTNIGQITSGTSSPSTGESIALGYVDPEFSKPGSEIFVRIRTKDIPAVVTKPPFYKA